MVNKTTSKSIEKLYVFRFYSFFTCKHSFLGLKISISNLNVNRTLIFSKLQLNHQVEKWKLSI